MNEYPDNGLQTTHRETPDVSYATHRLNLNMVGGPWLCIILHTPYAQHEVERRSKLVNCQSACRNQI